MDKAITTAMLIVISMVMAVMLFNVAYPAIVEGGDAIVNMADQQNDRLRSQITIVHAAAEWTNGAVQDTNGNGVIEVFVWVKNVGDTRLPYAGIERLDIFFGPQGNFKRIPHASESTTGTYWDATVVNATDWEPTATLAITIHQAPLQAGQQFLKVTMPNGIDSEYFWSL
ncbi:MAG TPA: hypothetical protein PKD09_03135 [Aggregatilinea sp.]|uniref:hypothetical protein n=1 Tax=Aggregatilinea sp. TaxID=2806333 RepID=UPI002C9B9DD1|nr:hypothetical protein [Aggregatilinea sp.]HML20615.1 hypothetical protein [Aggregatilinea sp.]